MGWLLSKGEKTVSVLPSKVLRREVKNLNNN